MTVCFAVGYGIQVSRLGVLGIFQSSKTYPVWTSPESFTRVALAVKLRACALHFRTELLLPRYLWIVRLNTAIWMPMLSFRLCAMTHQTRQRARYGIDDVVVVLAFFFNALFCNSSPNSSFDFRFTLGYKSLVCPQFCRPLVFQARHIRLLFQCSRRGPQQLQLWAKNR